MTDYGVFVFVYLIGELIPLDTLKHFRTLQDTLGHFRTPLGWGRFFTSYGFQGADFVMTGCRAEGYAPPQLSGLRLPEFWKK